MYCKGLEQNCYHEKHFGSLHDFGYKDFIPMMKGEAFDPEEWADLVVKSGARYAGPVTEHADNFSMWDSSVNPINSVNCGPHRDVFGECAKAFRERDIKLIATFHHQWLWGWFMSTDNEADVYIPSTIRKMKFTTVLPFLLRRTAICHTAIQMTNLMQHGEIRFLKLLTNIAQMQSTLTAALASLGNLTATRLQTTTITQPAILMALSPTNKKTSQLESVSMILSAVTLLSQSHLYGSLMTDLRTILPGVLYKIQSTNQQKRSLSSYAILFPKMEIYC